MIFNDGITILTALCSMAAVPYSAYCLFQSMVQEKGVMIYGTSHKFIYLARMSDW